MYMYCTYKKLYIFLKNETGSLRYPRLWPKTQFHRYRFINTGKSLFIDEYEQFGSHSEYSDQICTSIYSSSFKLAQNVQSIYLYYNWCVQGNVIPSCALPLQEA